MKKIFITGGTGFIGSHIVDHFSNNNDYEVYALVRDPDNLKWLNDSDIHVLKGDLFSIPSLPAQLDYVIHSAGCTKTNKISDYKKINRDGTKNLFESLVNQHISPKKIIYISSLGVTGPSVSDEPIKETQTPCPLTPYAESKLQGEEEALKFKKKFAIIVLRPGGVFGPRDTDFLYLFKSIKKGILPAIDSNQRLASIIYVKDLVYAVNLCLQKDIQSGEIFNIVNPQPYSWDEFGHMTSKILNKKLTKIIISYPVAFLIASFSQIVSKLLKNPSIIDKNKLKELNKTCWVADCDKAVTKLSFQPQYSLKEAIQETLNWYQEHNWL